MLRNVGLYAEHFVGEHEMALIRVSFPQIKGQGASTRSPSSPPPTRAHTQPSPTPKSPTPIRRCGASVVGQCKTSSLLTRLLTRSRVLLMMDTLVSSKILRPPQKPSITSMGVCTTPLNPVFLRRLTLPQPGTGFSFTPINKTCPLRPLKYCRHCRWTTSLRAGLNPLLAIIPASACAAAGVFSFLGVWPT